MQRKNILKNLSELPLDDEIKFKAQEIYSRLDCGIFRKKNRMRIIFHCVYMAHKELNKKCIPLELSKMFGLKQGDLQKLPEILEEEIFNNEKDISTEEITYDYLRKFAQELSFTEELTEDLIILTKQIIAKNKILLEEHPNTLASGFLIYFIKNNGIMLKNKNILEKLTNRSITTIEKIYKKIISLDV